MFESFIKFVSYIAVSGLLSNIFGYLLPRHLLNPDIFPYKSFKWEKDGRVYERIYVTKWKTKVPDMSKIIKSLYPKVLTRKPDSNQMNILILESCTAELVHVLLIAASPLLLRIIGGFWGKFYFVCNILGNIPYIIIQRYNRPKFKRVYALLCIREQKNHSLEETINESVNTVM
ncbi:MAG: hypothetical protein J6K12_06075 [Clostridia bacterium]|nr:hypothetical protein [Clostridia bacterium]